MLSCGNKVMNSETKNTSVILQEKELTINDQHRSCKKPPVQISVLFINKYLKWNIIL